MLVEFNPENALETAIVEAKSKESTIDELLNKISSSDIYVSSKTEVMQDGSGLSPLLLGDHKYPLVAIFSSALRSELHRAVASYVLLISGREFFNRLPPGYGAVLNPGYSAQLIISADSIPKKS